MTPDVGLFKRGEEVEWGTTIRGSVRRLRGTIYSVVPAGAKPEPPVGARRGDGAFAGEDTRDHESYIVRAAVDGEARFYWPRVSALAPVSPRPISTDHDRETLRAAERRALEIVTGERDALALEVAALRKSRALIAAVAEEFQERGITFSEALGESLVRHAQRVGAATSVEECKAAARAMLLEVREATPGPGPILTALVASGEWPITS